MVESWDGSVTGTFGEALRRLRLAAGWSQPKLARAVYVSQSFISKVETGAEDAPPEFARACDDALGAAGALVALAPARPPTTGGIEPWEIADLLTRTTLSMEALGVMRAAVLGYAADYPQAGPELLLAPVNTQLRRLRSALANPQPVAARREAVRLTGLLAGIAGNLALDLHREDRAESYFEVAQLAGRESDDGDLIAWALATRSLVPFFSGRPHEAAALLSEAQGIAARSAGQRRRAWILALKARADSAVGATSSALSALDSARAALDVADQPTSTDFFDEPRLAGMTGSTMLLLRRAREADELLTEALERREPGDFKGRALTTLDLAACRLIEGDSVEAADLVAAALGMTPGGIVAPIVSRARAVQTEMMAVDPKSAAMVGQLLAEAASPPSARSSP
jgi:transcriptional regulator with XRE-family HTH domain